MKIGQKALFLEISPTQGKVSELHLDEYFRNGQRYIPNQDMAKSSEDMNQALKAPDLSQGLQTHEFKLWRDDTNDIELESGLIEVSDVVTSPRIINTDMT